MITQDEIFEKYPELYQEKDLPMSASCMCWGLEVPNDWLPVIDKLSKVLSNLPPYSYKVDPKDESSYVQVQAKVVAKQVKIKFGGLRFYYGLELATLDFDPPEEEVKAAYNTASRYTDGAIAMAEQLCEGEPY
tara:strand:- start:25243 stop:25641 length:399 start_codon:yes stop_codon:yes gene_type:complete